MSNEVLILAITIFFARLIDVSLRSIRTIFLVEGKRVIPALLGFVEVSIWFLVIRSAITTQTGIVYVALAYGSGFALGHIIGSSIAERFIKQISKVVIVTSNQNEALVSALRNQQFGVTKIEASGINEAKKYYLYLEIMSKNLDFLHRVLAKYDPTAFVIINKSKDAINGHFY
jgi:uncharacterized protein YebE (UPF0316 family)